MRRVVVTGIGVVSPLGVTAASSWSSLISGGSGIIPTSDYVANAVAAQSTQTEFWPNENTYVSAIPAGRFDANRWKVQFSSNKTNSYAMAAASEALEDSGLLPYISESSELQEMCGVNIGVMSSNITRLTEIIQDTQKRGFSGLNRLTIFNILANMPSANLSIKFKLKGPSGTASTACATGASAIGDAFRLIQTGDARVMVAGGSEDSLSPTNMYASMKLQAMVTKSFPTAAESSRPFDVNRAGFVLGEGAGVVILEELSHAQKRGAKIYAELLSYGQSSDAFHITRPTDSGEGGLRAMKNALRSAGLSPTDIDHINTHATSTPAGDVSEALAIESLLNAHTPNCSITANKGAIGHTFGAAGAIESIFTILSLTHNISPLIKNLITPIAGSKLRFSQQNESHQITHALKNSFGFGGVNVSLIFKKHGASK